MTEIIIDWNSISQKKWDRLLKKAKQCSFQQAWGYGAIFEHGNLEVSRFVATIEGDEAAMGQIVTRRFFGFLKFTLLLKGPVWLKDISTQQKRQVIDKIRARYPLKYFNLFAFSPEDEPISEASEPASSETLNSYESMGFRRIITGNSTILIDLTLSEEQLWQNLYGKNRTHIRKGQKIGFDIVFGDHNHPHTEWLLAQERKQQKEKKYQGLPVELVQGYGHFTAKGNGVYTAFAVEAGADEPMSGVLFLCHGRCATYHIGWNGPRGRQSRALNLLLWKMIVNLKVAGFEVIDLGGLNTEEGADIARYKLSFGGKVISLSGTFM